MQGPAGAGPARRPQSLEERVARIERQLGRPDARRYVRRLDALTQQVQELRGRRDAHNTQGVEQRQREIYLDFDRRLRQLESATFGHAVSALPPLETPASPSPPTAEIRPTSKPWTPCAPAAIRNPSPHCRIFLTRYPESQYPSNAQYWLGEADYVTKRYRKVVAEFEFELLPQQQHHTDAMLKLGYSQYELGQADQASTTLARPSSPNTPAAPPPARAQNRLQRMKTRWALIVLLIRSFIFADSRENKPYRRVMSNG